MQDECFITKHSKWKVPRKIEMVKSTSGLFTKKALFEYVLCLLRCAKNNLTLCTGTVGYILFPFFP